MDPKARLDPTFMESPLQLTAITIEQLTKWVKETPSRDPDWRLYLLTLSSVRASAQRMEPWYETLQSSLVDWH